MKYTNYLLLVLFLLPMLTLAQSNYKPGEAVTLKGDTIRGLIDYQAWDSNPTGISFRTAIGDNTIQKFTVNDIVYFNIDGLVTYQKFTGRISMDETNTAHLTAGRDTGYRIGTVFLQLLQKGKNVSLYAYSDNLKVRFYLGEAPGFNPLELAFRLYDDGGALNGTEGSTVIGNTVYENTYQKTLFALANKYEALDDNMTRIFQAANYTKADLLAIVSKINHISAADYEKKYTEHSSINWFAGAALNVTAITTASSTPFSKGGGGSYTSYMPGVSFGVNIDPTPNSQKLQIRAELAISGAKFISEYQRKVSPFIPFKASFSEFNVGFIPQLIYNFYNTENLKFYGDFGVQITYLKYSNPYFGSKDPSVGLDYSDTSPYKFNTIDNALLLKAGVQFNKKFEIFVDYLTSTGITTENYFALNSSRKRVGFIYFFGK